MIISITFVPINAMHSCSSVDFLLRMIFLSAWLRIKFMKVLKT